MENRRRLFGGAQRTKLLRLARTSASTLKVAYLLVAWTLVLSFARPTNGQITLTDVPVAVLPQGNITEGWSVDRGGLFEKSDGVRGYVELTNISKKPISGALFYGEYFDAAGRFCFSLAFSQEMTRGRSKPIDPGESWKLESSGLGLFPASEPRTLRLYLVDIGSINPKPIAAWNVPARVPVVIYGSISGDRLRTTLRPDNIPRKDPILDLLFVKISVDAAGNVVGTEILNSVGKASQDWFLDCIRTGVRFYPASEGTMFKAGQALILVRAIFSERGLREALTPPRLTPEVRHYVDGLPGTELPPITQILLRTPPTEEKKLGSQEVTERPTAPLGTLELTQWNTLWSSGYGFVADPSMPHHLRRQFIPQSR